MVLWQLGEGYCSVLNPSPPSTVWSKPLVFQWILLLERTLPYWNDVIVPQMKDGKKILIAAHGNSLRGIVKHLDNMSDDDIMGLNLPTGIPFVYELDENLKVLSISVKF